MKDAIPQPALLTWSMCDMVCVLVQLDAAWKAALGGVSVVIASGKAKDGVLQVTAGVTSDVSLTSTMPVCPFPSTCLSDASASVDYAPFLTARVL